MLRSLVVLTTAALLAALTGCSSLAPLPCPSGQQTAVQDLLYFGTDKPEGSVSTEEWARYLDDTFTQGFPEGFTVWDASGEWRTANGEKIQEPTHVLSLVHPESAAAERSIRDFIAAYETRFQQEAVLRVTSSVCISF